MAPKKKNTGPASKKSEPASKSESEKVETKVADKEEKKAAADDKKVDEGASEKKSEEVAEEQDGNDSGNEDMDEEQGSQPDEGDEPDDDKAEGSTPAAKKTDAAEDGEDADGDEEDDEASTKDPKKDKPKESEVDAEPDDRDRLASTVALSDYDSTLNVFFSAGGSSGSIVSSLSQGGLQHLLAGVRANTGVKAGRYFFEAKVMEKRSMKDPGCTLRLGVSLAKSSLFLGDGTPDSASFDVEGFYYAAASEDTTAKKRKAFSRKLQFQTSSKSHLLWAPRDNSWSHVIGILLNLEKGSPNANTLSVFLDGLRICEPQPLPAHLVGKALFPTFTFKNYTLAVNLGNDGLVMKGMPFKCRMVGEIAAEDAELSNIEVPSSSSKYSVVLPVGLPEEGFFDYVDRFIESHPEYVELSDRKIKEWCVKSGLEDWKTTKGQSRDRPVFNFGIQSIDNRGVRLQIKSLTQLVKRHYLVAELKGNLVSKEREEVLARFAAPHFSVAAHIAIGEPNADHKDWVHAKIRTAFDKKQADLAKRKQREEERKKQNEEKKVKDEDKAKKEDVKKEEDKNGDVKKEKSEKSDEPPAKKQKVGDDESKDKEEAPAPPVTGPNVWYLPRTRNMPEDVGNKTVSQFYSSFTLPADGEGFDKVVFPWARKPEAEEYLQKWMNEKKATLIVEGLKPGEWFTEKEKAWKQLLKEMKSKKQEKEKKAKEAEKSADKDKDKKDKDKDKDKDDDEDKKEEEAPDPLHAGGEDGKPLYASFLHEDWELLSWRYELHLLLHAFVIDVKDSDTIGVPVDHINHYYDLYYCPKKFRMGNLGCKSLDEVVDLMDDVLRIEPKGKMKYLVPLMDKDAEILQFVRKIEDFREDRHRRIEAGDESARLKIPEAASRGREGGGDRRPKGGGKEGKRTTVKPVRRYTNDSGKGDAPQERRSNFARQRTFLRRNTTYQDKGQNKGGFKRTFVRPREETGSRPWERTREKGTGKNTVQRFGTKGSGKRTFAATRTRDQQDSRRATDNKRQTQGQERRPAQRHIPAFRSSIGAAPARRRTEPEAKRTRYNDPPAPPRPPTTTREATSERRPQSRQESKGRGREAAAPALPSASSRGSPRESSRSGKGEKGDRGGKGGGSKSSNHTRDSGGHSRENKGNYRDGGSDRRDKGSHRSSDDKGAASSSTKDARGKSSSKGDIRHSGGNSRSDGGSDRRSHDDGRDRFHSSGKGDKGSKGSKGGGRDSRRDGGRDRDRGGHSDHRGSDRDHHRGGDRDRDRRW